MIKISPGKEPQGCFRACLATNIHHYLQRLSKMFVIVNIFSYQTLYAVPLKPEGKICFFHTFCSFDCEILTQSPHHVKGIVFLEQLSFKNISVFTVFVCCDLVKKKNGNTFLLIFFQTFSKN